MAEDGIGIAERLVLMPPSVCAALLEGGSMRGMGDYLPRAGGGRRICPYLVPWIIVCRSVMELVVINLP